MECFSCFGKEDIFLDENCDLQQIWLSVPKMSEKVKEKDKSKKKVHSFSNNINIKKWIITLVAHQSFSPRVVNIPKILDQRVTLNQQGSSVQQIVYSIGQECGRAVSGESTWRISTFHLKCNVTVKEETDTSNH